MLRISKISNYNEFKELKGAWGDLLSRAKIDNIFLTHDWVDAYIKHFCENQKLLILNIFKDGELIGLAPMMIRRYKYFGFPVRSICFIGTAISDRMDFILNENKKEGINLILDYIMTIKDEWDSVDFQEIAKDTGTFEIVKEWLAKKSVINIQGPFERSFFIELNGNKDILSSKFSKKLYRKLKKIDDKWGSLNFDFKRYLGKDCKIRKVFSEINMLESRSWKSKKAAIFSRQNTKSFHREIFDRFSKNKWLDLSILNLSDKPIAYIYNYYYKGRLYNYNTAFDRRYSRFSPGTVLLFWILSDSFKDNISEFDFGRGEDQWKTRITQKSITHTRVRLFKNTFYSRFIYYLQSKFVPYAKKIRKLARSLWK